MSSTRVCVSVPALQIGSSDLCSQLALSFLQAMGIFIGLPRDTTLSQTLAVAGGMLSATSSWWGEAGVLASSPGLPP